LALLGAQVDVSMARRTKVLDKLTRGKKAMLDKGYVGLDLDKICVPFKGAWHQLTIDQQTHNAAINSVRVDIERSIRVVKKWDCLNINWRHSLDLHPAAFHVCANLANIFMDTHPIRTHVNPWLM
jgi:hypothetical protein